MNAKRSSRDQQRKRRRRNEARPAPDEPSPALGHDDDLTEAPESGAPGRDEDAAPSSPPTRPPGRRRGGKP